MHGLRETAIPRASGITRFSVVRSSRVAVGLKNPIWEFPKIGDPNIVPLIVGSLL